MSWVRTQSYAVKGLISVFSFSCYSSHLVDSFQFDHFFYYRSVRNLLSYGMNRDVVFRNISSPNENKNLRNNVN